MNEISHVERLDEQVPELFEILTEENDKLGRWTSHSFPVQLTFENSDSKKKVKFIEGTKVISGNDQIDNFHVSFYLKKSLFNYMVINKPDVLFA